MNESREELLPVFGEFGAAVLDAQLLEQGLGFLMALVAKYQGAHFSSRPDISLYGSEEGKTLGELFRAVKKKEYFTQAEEKIIRRAIRTRNKLVHSFLVDKAEDMMTPKGRREVLSEVVELRDTIRKADTIVNECINKYLIEHGTSIEEAKIYCEQFWVSDDKPGFHGIQ